jgi:hypothetical protein
MIFLSFDNFLNENANLSGKEFVNQFIDNIANGIPYLGVPEDVWCMPEDLFNSYRKANSDVTLAIKAEKFESEQRKLPVNSRIESPYFLIEYRVNVTKGEGFNDMHFYRLIGINTESKELILIGTMGGFEDKIEKIFDDLLKKYYPVLSTSRKYGL